MPLRLKITTGAVSRLVLCCMGLASASVKPAYGEEAALNVPVFELLANSPAPEAKAPLGIINMTGMGRLLRSPTGPQWDGTPLPDGPAIHID
ncbi:MAG: hypothetical protein RLY97_1907, partial [Pseudomonadota bacterium]